LKGTGLSLKGTGLSLKGTGLSLKGTGLSLKGTGFSPYISLARLDTALAAEGMRLPADWNLGAYIPSIYNSICTASILPATIKGAQPHHCQPNTRSAPRRAGRDDP
jgi:hypothetical protein